MASEARVDRRLLLVIGGLCLVAAGYPTFISHPITLLASVPLLAMLLLIDHARLAAPAWIVGVAVIMIWTVLLYLAMDGTARGLIYSLAMAAPFAALACRIRRPEPVALLVAVATVTLASARVMTSWVRSGAEWQPWQVYEGNDLAPRITMLLPLVILAWVVVPADRRRLRSLLVVVIACGAMSVAMTLQRAALGVFMVLLLAGLARTYWKGLIVVVLGSLVAWLVASSSIEAALERVRLVNFVNSHATRPEIWGVALDAVRGSSWLGVGPGNADDALREVGGGHAHNGLVQAALEAGWPGAALFAAVVAYVCVLAARLLRQGGRDALWALPLLGYLGFSLMSAPLLRPDFTLILVLVIMAAREQVKPRGERWVA